MTRTHRVLDVLALFTEQTPRLRAADIGERLGVAQASVYRYLEDLIAHGLVESDGTAHYVLGPAVVELDRRIRVSDPLIGAAAPVMERLAERVGGVVLLCRLHGRKVLCVHQVVGERAPRQVSYERGRAMPLYRGATSRAILAQLPSATIADMVAHDAPALAEAGLPTELQALLAYLQTVREAKAWHSAGEVDADAAGWAAPIRQGRQVLGSLSVVLRRSARAAWVLAPGGVADQVWRAALRIEGRLGAPGASTLP